MRVFKYYYYRLFSYFQGGSSVPFFRVFLIIFAFALLNFLSVMSLCGVILDKDLKLTFVEKANHFWSLVIIVPLFGLFYYYLKKLGYHKIIFEEFDKETTKEKRSSQVIVILYFIISIIFFVLSLWLKQEIKK